MAAQAGLCLAWFETPEDTFCRVVAQIYIYALMISTERIIYSSTSNYLCYWHILFLSILLNEAFIEVFENRGTRAFIKGEQLINWKWREQGTKAVLRNIGNKKKVIWGNRETQQFISRGHVIAPPPTTIYFKGTCNRPPPPPPCDDLLILWSSYQICDETRMRAHRKHL